MIRIYLRYKFHAFREGIFRSSRQLGTYWDIFFAYFIFAGYMKVVYDSNSYVIVGVVSGIVLLVLTVWADYASGMHIHWYRTEYRKKLEVQDHG